MVVGMGNIANNLERDNIVLWVHFHDKYENISEMETDNDTFSSCCK